VNNEKKSHLGEDGVRPKKLADNKRNKLKNVLEIGLKVSIFPLNSGF